MRFFKTSISAAAALVAMTITAFSADMPTSITKGTDYCENAVIAVLAGGDDATAAREWHAATCPADPRLAPQVEAAAPAPFNPARFAGELRVLGGAGIFSKNVDDAVAGYKVDTSSWSLKGELLFDTPVDGLKAGVYAGIGKVNSSAVKFDNALINTTFDPKGDASYIRGGLKGDYVVYNADGWTASVGAGVGVRQLNYTLNLNNGTSQSAKGTFVEIPLDFTVQKDLGEGWAIAGQIEHALGFGRGNVKAARFGETSLRVGFTKKF